MVVWGGVLTTLLFTLLFSLASCDNGSTSSPSEKNPEIVATYGLSGDKIFLYDDMTFIISLKDSAGTISGTYAAASDYTTLLVGKKSGNVANVGNILKLKVADDKIEVMSSDIDRYAEGEKGEQTGGSQNPGDISSPSETKPTVVATYGLNGDEISLYNDKTFTISLKDSTSKISGLYASVAGYMTLLVDKESVNLAKSGDVLKLKVTDNKIEVISSDIDRYAEGDDGEQTGGAQNPGDADNPLGEPPAENLRLPKDYYSAMPCDDGIYFEFSVPNGARGGDACTVSIEGIGQVAEAITLNENRNKGSFFYPFVKPDTKYTVRFTFPREEDHDDEGFVIDYISDGTVGWFETTAIAGKNSLGEVKLTNKGAIEDKDINKNGDFRFTTKPTFEGGSLLKDNWFVNIGLVEGVSWEHGDDRKTKWSGEVNIPSTELSNTFNLYTYDENGSYRNNNLVINFLCFRPRMYYEYEGKKYLYQWDGVTKDTPQLGSEARLWQTIDISKPEGVAKIKGTWKCEEVWGINFSDGFRVNEKTTLVIDESYVKQIQTLTKPDNSEFTQDELKMHWSSLVEDENITDNETESNYNVSISTDGKTITEEVKRTLSSYFEKGDNGYPMYKIFENQVLRIIYYGKDYEGNDCEFPRNFKKQS